MPSANYVSVVADVGGTNTRAALAVDGVVQTQTITRYKNAGRADLGEILTQFLTEQDQPDCAGACVAMAGPVMDGIGRLTNVGWTFGPDQLAACSQAQTVAILNDLQAQGHALDHISDTNLTPLVPGPAGDDHMTKLVIGVGTGFNAVPVFRTDQGRFVPACEAGHASLPVQSDDHLALAHFVAKAHGFPGVEDVLSGRGFERVFSWISGQAKDAADIMATIDSDPHAAKAVEVFVQTLGRVTGDLALTHLPFGGIYLVGGVARAMEPHLDRFGYTDALRSKGRFSDFMQRFAVWAVEDDYAALTGCARHLDGVMT